MKSTDITGLSVVIPHYGDPVPTAALIEQLRQHSSPVPVQIVVSDDASPQAFPAGEGYQVVRRATNGGFGAAVNAGVTVAFHDALLVLNSDVSLPPTALDDLVQGAQPWWPAVVSTKVHQGSGELCVPRLWPKASHHVLEWSEPLARFHGQDWVERAMGNDVAGWHAQVPVVTDWAIGVCLLIPTQDFRAIGGFDERFFMNCEEADLQWRLKRERGLPVVVLAQPVLDHVGGGSSDPVKRGGWVTDARFRYHEKWHGGAGLRWGLEAATAVNLGWNAARSVAGRSPRPRENHRRQRALIAHAWRTRGGTPSGGPDA
ncbi:glycosyltransferase family 2 protein [Rudaeicoccus suwonensis]|uniref:N-acetylglucosaminyl-diphospho-decaprenol L-rhamnosyltransferase n=1 Tax=Rudaeicoccus suwonensis TaxID=657409 RepID=A0A561E8Q8_9MICO|nr:glycosyltransferase family 2 protein [Rudaeicoccus suwonensis]TWE11987.1 N-acetylglucosaminyl-diphospho-decaprenol L-rhamnosyltransferase [Rudaeicoccus suwonensis]